jgi:prefoldin subunit 4
LIREALLNGLCSYPSAFLAQLRREEEETDGIEVTWGEQGSFMLHGTPAHQLHCYLACDPDDQQRINNFSKYNTRLSDIQSQLKRKKVGTEGNRSACVLNADLRHRLQEEREYYDDLEMELELADEDGQVL